MADEIDILLGIRAAQIADDGLEAGLVVSVMIVSRRWPADQVHRRVGHRLECAARSAGARADGERVQRALIREASMTIALYVAAAVLPTRLLDGHPHCAL